MHFTIHCKYTFYLTTYSTTALVSVIYKLCRKNKSLSSTPFWCKKIIENANTFLCFFNSLQLSDATWWHKSPSALSQITTCCLTAPRHYLHQCWLIIKGVHLRGLSSEVLMNVILNMFPWSKLMRKLANLIRICVKTLHFNHISLGPMS